MFKIAKYLYWKHIQVGKEHVSSNVKAQGARNVGGQNVDEDVKCIFNPSNYTPGDNEHYILCMEWRGRCDLCFSLGRVDGGSEEDKGMGKLIKLKIKPKKDKKVEDFLEQLETAKALFLQGDLDKVIIIASGPDLKCCTSNGIMVLEAKEICRDFIKNSKEYAD